MLFFFFSGSLPLYCFCPFHFSMQGKPRANVLCVILTVSSCYRLTCRSTNKQQRLQCVCVQGLHSHHHHGSSSTLALMGHSLHRTTCPVAAAPIQAHPLFGQQLGRCWGCFFGSTIARQKGTFSPQCQSKLAEPYANIYFTFCLHLHEPFF